jgi:hypothetical protein
MTAHWLGKKVSNSYDYDMGIRSLLAACLCWSAIAFGQTSMDAETYDVKDAYRIYGLLLPHEESYGFAKGTLTIQEETVSNQDVTEPCVTPQKAIRFKDAIADYNRLNRKKQWLLRRQFAIEKSYEVVSSDAIGVLLQDGGWDSFYNRYPDSGGYIIMSAVGFNKERTRAIVYMGSSCGVLCGSWRFHLLEKIDGDWKEVSGVTCSTVS